MILYTSKTEAAAKKAFQAALEGDLKTVSLLVDHSMNTEDCDPEGNSLLHYAVRGRNLEVVRYLTQVCGMSPLWANSDLVTPYEEAGNLPECREKEEILNFFQEICGFPLEETYKNPVCRGMHADPSIVRVGEDYYMVNSSFVYFPCIPITHSRDLVHWEVIGHAVTDREWAKEHLGHLEGGRGFWAPDISYYNGRFYICATLRNNDDAPYIQTQMVTSASRPEGPYETPVIHNVLGIDPSLFADDDGRRYMLINRGARIMEVSGDGKEILSEPKMIWYGHSGHAPEGPHLLKKDGYYYCFLAEGGTGKGHMITVARSRNLMGPYEDCPYNPIMTQKDEIAPIQCCGHGKPVQTPDGRWFMVYLCSRFLEGQWGMLGRETCLDEVTWTADGWPLVNGGKGPSYLSKLPLPLETGHSAKEEGNQNSLWMAPRTIDPARIQIGQDGWITIQGDGKDLCCRECESLLVKNQPDFCFTAGFSMELLPQGGEHLEADAGMVLYYDENTYVKFGVTQNQVFIAEYVDDRYVRQERMDFSFEGKADFSVETIGLKRKFYFNHQLLWTWDRVTSICSEGLVKGKRFTGAMYGVYVNGSNLLRWRQHSKV